MSITVLAAGCSASRPELLLDTPAPAPATRQRRVEVPLVRDHGPMFQGERARSGFDSASAHAIPVFLAAMPEVSWKSGRSYPTTSDTLYPPHTPAAAARGVDSSDPGVWSLGFSGQGELPPLPFDPHEAPEEENQAPHEPRSSADGRPYFFDGYADGVAFLPGTGYTYVFESHTLLDRETGPHGKWHRPADEDDSSLKSLIQKLRVELLQFEVNGVPVQCDASLKGRKVVFKLKMKM